MNTPTTWTDAYKQLRNDGYTITEARIALGKLLDGELELEQVDGQERIITQAELEQAKKWAEEQK